MKQAILIMAVCETATLVLFVSVIIFTVTVIIRDHIADKKRCRKMYAGNAKIV